MSQDKARIHELEQMLLLLAGGLRSKARVYANQRTINPAAAGDPVQILNTAADELQTAVGGSLTRDGQYASANYRCDSVQLVIGDQLRQFGPREDGKVAAHVGIEISQELLQVRDPIGRLILERPDGLHFIIDLQPTEGSELSPGENHELH